ncbi:MAG: extracellular solute-binding protein [Clostridia bacterium]|nr:extracellular solute-binding protein [Clostridia bacterium]
MLKRFLCLVTALLVLPAACFAQEFVMAGFDGQDSTRDWETNGFFTRMQERTGLTFTFQEYTDQAEWQAAKDAMFAQGGQLPDVLFKAALTSDELIRYTDSGQLIDLLPLLEEHAPNLWALLQENPDWLRAITLPNGKVGALPMIQTVPTQNLIWINQAWLEELYLEMPTDMESFMEVLAAFKERDPNGNGRADETPMLFIGPWELKFFSHAYGVVVNDYNLYLDDAGQVHYWPLEDSFATFLQDMRQMYLGGLLDPNGFETADSLRQITDEKATVTYGAFFAPTPLYLLPLTQSQDYVALLPLKAADGTQVYRDLNGQISRGTFAITSACADPAALLRWVDVLYTEEGAIEAMVGKEGDCWSYTADGHWKWHTDTETTYRISGGEVSVTDTGEMPMLFPKAFNANYGEDSVRHITDQCDLPTPYLRMAFPYYTLTDAQRAQVKPLQQELGLYVDVAIANFVLGETPINNQTLAEFRSGLEQLGAAEMTAFWQDIADSLNP